ncbi:cytochrome c biogenesis CcmF C-terminal-like mitochondrial protein [Magnolia sinica]|uniref:cytochrome c biogenesis CcmF C-terminal-like mitochondrial protein n=1 Tax=Magnolia sinica TaxID=86752 RepID=UPI002658A186|nr:cytochrome c biogenesis CcmF C-terminal-like mitochondrial protein [Magnolia sinica]
MVGVNWYPFGMRCEHFHFERLIFSGEAKIERIEQMVQLQNFFFFITSMVVPRGTAAPVLLKWFVSRDVPTGAPSSNGTIIPIPIPEFPFLVYLHSRKFIRSMDGAKSGVLVRASRPILLPDIIGRSSSETRARNASFRFVPVLNFLLLESMGDLSYLESFCGVLCLLFFRTLFSLPRDRSAKRERARRRKRQTLRPNGNEQGLNDKMRCPGHPHFIERRVEGFGPVAFPVPPSSGGACVGGVPPEIGLEALALPTSRPLMAVGHDYYQKAPMRIHISHGGVCIFMLGVLLSCDPAAYVRPVAHASYLFRAGGVNSDSIRVFNPAAEMLS